MFIVLEVEVKLFYLIIKMFKLIEKRGKFVIVISRNKICICKFCY